ncbi:hypothetical protein [Roseateles oligotrophus]|uniref:Uncharacterized protein n=1 Tax=Roseateles oligotrophus TaxID=1769250 RepID=A0ABT2YKB7_9BURK|nr:hypothetical protein [Roseateles oligotrophus]MCV2370503.1 hypothetical protein [Roseateles oligotrophus]
MDYAGITLTVNTFISVTEGAMQTGGTNPNVGVQVDAGSSSRVTLNNDGSLRVTGGDPTGSKTLTLNVTVLSANTDPASAYYPVVGLIVKQTTVGAEVSNAWGSYTVGTGAAFNTLQVLDKDTVPVGAGSVSYEFFVLIQTPTAAGSIGDYGLIDPRITNL